MQGTKFSLTVGAPGSIHHRPFFTLRFRFFFLKRLNARKYPHCDDLFFNSNNRSSMVLGHQTTQKSDYLVQ